MRRFNVCLVLLATASFYSGCTNGDDDTGDKNVGGSKADSATAGKSSKGGSGGVGGSTER
jgi:hypothetical protein